MVAMDGIVQVLTVEIDGTIQSLDGWLVAMDETIHNLNCCNVPIAKLEIKSDLYTNFRKGVDLFLNICKNFTRITKM